MSSRAGLQTGLAWLGPPQLGLWLCLARGDPGKLRDSAWMLLVFYLSEIMQDIPVGRRLATSGLLCASPQNAHQCKACRARTRRPGLFRQATGNPDSEHCVSSRILEGGGGVAGNNRSRRDKSAKDQGLYSFSIFNPRGFLQLLRVFYPGRLLCVLRLLCLRYP
jgi:hypothetical protein